MSYEDALKGLSAGTAHVIEQLWAAVEAGRLPRDDFPDLAAQLIGIARLRGAAAAELAFRGFLEAADAAPVPILAAARTGAEHARLAQAITTILNSDLDTMMQLVRLAGNEPLDAAATTYADVMARSGRVSGWRRGVEGNACQLCRWWWREGRVFHKTHRMPRHPGCACHQVPVLNERTENYQTTQQSADAAARRR